MARAIDVAPVAFFYENGAAATMTATTLAPNLKSVSSKFTIAEMVRLATHQHGLTEIAIGKHPSDLLVGTPASHPAPLWRSQRSVLVEFTFLWITCLLSGPPPPPPLQVPSYSRHFLVPMLLS
ncbi:hypothetical protein V8C86DRAFT_2435766 [Haematococcus lacustris]